MIKRFLVVAAFLALATPSFAQTIPALNTPPGFTGGADLVLASRTIEEVLSGTIENPTPDAGETSLPQAPVPAPVGPADSVAWDYSDANIAAAQVVVFAVTLDTNPPIQLQVAAAKHPTLAGTYIWKLPTLPIGTHTVTVQACNAGTCSSAASFTFNLVIQPVAPSNLRAIKG